MDIEVGKLIESIGLSVQEAQNTLNQFSEQSFLRYFDVNDKPQENDYCSAKGNGKTNCAKTLKEIKPKFYYFNLPQTNDNELLAVPTVALTKHSSLALNHIKIKLNVSGSVMCDQFYVNVETAPKKDGKIDSQLVHEIEMEFKCSEPAEGISRIQDSANQFI